MGNLLGSKQFVSTAFAQPVSTYCLHSILQEMAAVGALVLVIQHSILDGAASYFVPRHFISEEADGDSLKYYTLGSSIASFYTTRTE